MKIDLIFWFLTFLGLFENVGSTNLFSKQPPDRKIITGFKRNSFNGKWKTIFSPNQLKSFKENPCSEVSHHSYIKELGKCVPQVTLHSECNFTLQCSDLVYSSECRKSLSDPTKTLCQCKEHYIQSSQGDACIPKRKCKLDKENYNGNGFISTEPNRGNCRRNEICLTNRGSDNFCICGPGYGMDENGVCQQNLFAVANNPILVDFRTTTEFNQDVQNKETSLNDNKLIALIEHRLQSNYEEFKATLIQIEKKYKAKRLQRDIVISVTTVIVTVTVSIVFLGVYLYLWRRRPPLENATVVQDETEERLVPYAAHPFP